MTDYVVCAIKDVVTGCFGEPKIFINEESAKRWFNSFCNKSEFGFDLQLYFLGNYNVNTGEILPNVQFLLNGAKEA